MMKKLLAVFMIKNYKKLNYKMSGYYPPYKNSSNNIKVKLDLTNYATKDDVKNITHVDVSSFASKTNLATLKTIVDKIDVDKLKTTPTDLAKLSNVVKNDVVKKTDYNAKVTSIESQIAGVTKTSNFVLKTKFSADINTLDDKIDGVEKKIPNINGLATKTSLNDCLKTSTFNSKVTEVESKIKDADIIAKSAVTKANTIRSNLASYATKADVTAIKNDYVTNASLRSQLNNLKSQHIATEVRSIDNKTIKNASDILGLENKLNENERGLSIFRGFFFYLQQNHLVYECKVDSFTFNNKNILKWRSTGIFNYSDYYSMNSIDLFVNGKQELKFKAKTDQLVKEKLCIGHLSDQWTTSESEKTGVYGKIYDFVVDYEQIANVKTIYDMHRYLINEHNISP